MTLNLAPIGPEAAFARGGPREATGVADRARRVGSGRPGALHPDPPTPAPAGLPGPASLVWAPLVSGTSSCWDPPITHPVYPSHYPPGIPTLLHTTVSAGHAQYGGHCGNSCFGPGVGEPRGSRTHPGFRSPTGYIQLFEVKRVCTAV